MHSNFRSKSGLKKQEEIPVRQRNNVTGKISCISIRTQVHIYIAHFKNPTMVYESHKPKAGGLMCEGMVLAGGRYIEGLWWY